MIATCPNTDDVASGTAATAASCTTGTLARHGGPGSTICVLIAHLGDVLSTPVTSVTYGSDNLSFIAGQSSGVGNIGIELWATATPTVTSDVVTVNFGAGTSTSIIVSAFELVFCGATGFAATVNGGSGTASPITASVTAGGGEGRTSTIFVPTDSIIIGMGSEYVSTSLSTMNLTSGTGILSPTTAGSTVNKIAAASAFTAATGGSDTLSWSESTDREYACLAVEFGGRSLDGMFALRAGQVLPNSF
jgi:hypothetical protein